MGIATSTLSSREPTADVEASATEATTTSASTSTFGAADHCVSGKSSCASADDLTSSADEMSDADDGGGDQQGRRQHAAVAVSANDSESVDTNAPTTSASTSDSASEVADPQRRRHESTTTAAGDQTLDEFREELRIKREQRRTAIADLKNEVLQLRSALAAERAANQQLRTATGGVVAHMDGVDDGGEIAVNVTAAAPARDESSQVADNNNDALVDDGDDGDESASPQRRSVETVLRMQLANVNHQLQLANGDVLSLGAELAITQKQVGTLKEVIAVSKEMVGIREAQLEQMKGKLKEIEDSLAEREMTIMSDTLRQEYDRQLANIRSLRTLYEERARVSAAEKENLMRQLETKRAELETEMTKSQDLEARVATLESELQETINNLTNVKDDLIDCKTEKKGLEEETAVINQLFSQLLSGFNGGNDLNIDKLAAMLEDNRDLLSDITTNETCKSRAAAMPKLLLDLVTQIDEEKPADVVNEESVDTTDATAIVEPSSDASSSAETKRREFLNNLPKVWKVLIELLNHQQTEAAPVPINASGDTDECYKLIATPSGPQNVLSVSKTYIRLKDLILEKKSLQKETHKLKNLNTHLETQLDQKERRLATVTVELNKTWTLVGRMQRQHRQLHTNEQILRYQLSQKRRLLNELKEELEYCRRKWTLAREKNDESQSQWTALRSEFTARKLQDAGSQLSAESGYSDEAEEEEEEDEEPLELIATVDEKEMIDVEGTFEEANAGAENICSIAIEDLPTSVVIGMPVIVQHQNNVGQSASGSSGSQNGKDSGGAGKSSVVLSRELRTKKKPKKPKASKTTATEGPESLEQMFYRISGLAQPEPSDESSSEEEALDSEYDDDDIDEEIDIHEPADDDRTESTDLNAPADDEEDDGATDAAATRFNADFIDPEDEERRQRRAERFERLEEQCQQLITQVRRTSTRGEELNRQLDTVHNRYRTPTREDSLADPAAAEAGGPSTSAASASSTPAEEEDASLLTAREQEYTSRRAARLQRLEEECQAFLTRMSSNNTRATELNERATTLHEHHAARLAGARGESSAASAASAAQTPDVQVDAAAVPEEIPQSSPAEHAALDATEATSLLPPPAESDDGSIE